MYLRKMRPRTTCLYSAASMLPRNVSAAAQSLSLKPCLPLPDEPFDLADFALAALVGGVGSSSSMGARFAAFLACFWVVFLPVRGDGAEAWAFAVGLVPSTAWRAWSCSGEGSCLPRSQVEIVAWLTPTSAAR